MIPAVAALFLGVGIPWFLFRLGGKYPLGRGEFVLWFGLTFAVVMGTLLLLGFFVPGGPDLHANALALGISLACIATRRLRDLNMSPWWALLSLLWPFSLLGHFILMLLPGPKKT